MHYRTLGRTGYDVSTISFGAWAIGGDWGEVEDVESMAALHAAVDAGVNFFDTADVYGDGRSERLMADLAEDGKVRHYGVSVEKVEEALKAIEYPNVETVQVIFNIFRQRPAELFFEQAREKQIGILARVPLASGLLTGKMSTSTTFDENDHRRYNRHGEAFDRGETFAGVEFERGLKAADELAAITPEGLSMAQFALRWILMSDAVTCAIPGAKRPDQAVENAAAADAPALPPGTMERVREIYDAYIRDDVHHRW